MNYITRTDIVIELRPADLIAALDDNRDGVEDVGLLDSIIAKTSRDVDGSLGGAYATPFSAPFPPKVVEATRIFVLETLFRRRNYTDDANPFAAQAHDLRQELRQIARGDIALAGVPTASVPEPPAAFFGAQSPTFSKRGNTPI